VRRVGLRLAVAGLWLVTAVAVAVAGAQPALSIGGHFTLEDIDGRTVTQASFPGKWPLIYFGFTSCPQTCPTALHQIRAALDALGPDGSSVQPVFVTLDPERDTPERLGAYLEHFDPRIIGLRGSRAQIDAAVAAFRVYFRVNKKTPQSEAYTIDHSSFLFLMKPDGSFARVLPADGSGHALADELRAQLRP
jgi:protein SCO1/2